MQFFLDMRLFLLSLTLGCSEGCYTVSSWWPRKQCQAELITLMGKTKLHKKVSYKLQVNHISKVMLSFDSRIKPLVSARLKPKRGKSYSSVFIYRKNIVCKSLSQIILETCTQQFVTLDFQECTMKELQMFGFVLLVLCDWSRKCLPPSFPIIFKTNETNLYLALSVFGQITNLRAFSLSSYWLIVIFPTTFNTLISVCIFSIILSIHFHFCWWGEFV